MIYGRNKSCMSEEGEKGKIILKKIRLIYVPSLAKKRGGNQKD